MGVPVGCCIYLPPGYESAANGRRYPVVYYLPGGNTWDLARGYAAKPTPKLRILVHVGTECFNSQNTLQYMTFLDSLEIPLERLIVPNVSHNAQQIYAKKGLALMRFHADNLQHQDAD